MEEQSKKSSEDRPNPPRRNVRNRKYRTYEKKKPSERLQETPSTECRLQVEQPPNKTAQRRRAVTQLAYRTAWSNAQKEDNNVGADTIEYAERFGSKVVNRTSEQSYRKLYNESQYTERLRSYQKKGGEQPSHFRFTRNAVPPRAETLSDYSQSRWQQRAKIKRSYAHEFRKKRIQESGGMVPRKRKNKTRKTERKISTIILFPIAVFLLIPMAFSSCTMLLSSVFSSSVATTYTAEDNDILIVEATYIAKETELQNQVDNIESTNSGYDEYVYHMDDIGHNPHFLAALLTAKYQAYTPSQVSSFLEIVYSKMYTLTLTPTVEIRTRTVTNEDGTTSTETYEWHILTVTLVNNPITDFAKELLTDEQYELFLILQQTQGNKPDIFGDGNFSGGSGNSTPSTDLSGVVFVDGTRTGNQSIVDIALSQEGQVGGYPYWSWYGFSSRVEWCACFVSWVLNQAGYSEPRFSSCNSGGVPYFVGKGQWADSSYHDVAAGDIIFFDWNGDGVANHVGIVIGTDGERVYTVEGNSGDSCKIRSYSLNSTSIKGYGLMN